MNSEKLLIIGCGDIGQRLARRLSESGLSIIGLKRHPPAQSISGLEWCAGDAVDPACLWPLLAKNFTYILLTLTPSARTDEGYRLGYVEPCRQLLAGLTHMGVNPQRLIFASSTSVYAQCDGEWLDEDSPAQPADFNGQRLLEAEELLLASGLPVTRVRFSGIYGPGRTRLISQLRSGHLVEPQNYSNRIHAEDCAGFLAHLLGLAARGEPVRDLYLASDSSPVLLGELGEWLASRMEVTWLKPVVSLTAGNKRIDNRRMLDSGYVLRYPDYRSGYSAVLTELD